jgi:hypothetical protein
MHGEPSIVAMNASIGTSLVLSVALLTLPLLRQLTYSDSLGVFRFRDLPEGRHRVQARRLGYEVQTDSVQISPLFGSVAVYDLAGRRVECATIANQR